MKHCLETPASLRESFQVDKTRLDIIDFVETKLRPLEDDKAYQDCVHGIYNLETLFTEELMLSLAEVFGPFISEGKPGHDKGHNRRDLLGACALLATDPTLSGPYARIRFPEKAAGLLAAWLHDIATSVGPRYQDNFWECGHAEVGAYLFFYLTEDLLPEPFRRLVAYAIAAHTNYLKPVDIVDPIKYEVGWQRQPWNDEIFETIFVGSTPVEDDFIYGGFKYRVAVKIARFADRLDANGVGLFARHLLAMADASENEGGRDLSEGQFFEINHEALKMMITPVVRPDRPKPPTVLEHMLMFSDSNFGNSAYSVGDSETMNEFMRYRRSQILAFIKAAGERPDKEELIMIGDHDVEVMWEEFADYLSWVSKSPYLDEALTVVRQMWDAIPLDEKVSWHWAINPINMPGRSSFNAHDAYKDSLTHLEDNILRGPYAETCSGIQQFALHALAELR